MSRNRKNNKIKKNIKNGKRINEGENLGPFYLGILNKKSRTFGFVIPLDENKYDEILENYSVAGFNLSSGIIIPARLIHPLDEDIYVSKKDLYTANNGDICIVRKIKKGNDYTSEKYNCEGEIIEIIKRNINIVVGKFTKLNSYGFVVPKDKTFVSDIYIPNGADFGAKTGDIVGVEIVKYVNSSLSNSKGKIVKIVARDGENRIKLKTLLAENDMDRDFPADVLKEARKIPKIIRDEEIEKRVDNRDDFSITIDSIDAKDLDDAISLVKKENYILKVSIADVSHYVLENSKIDKEALKRGNSTYLIDTVIPMLPVELSNDICSLNALEDRLSITCEMEIDNDGEILSSKIYKSIEKIKKRTTYKETQEIIDGMSEEEYYEKYPEFKNFKDFKKLKESLLLMDRLAKVMLKRRIKKGYISFNIKEEKIILDNIGRAIAIEEDKEYFTYKIIEQFMLSANMEVAKFLDRNNIVGIFRVHENPDVEKIEKLNEKIQILNDKINVFKIDKNSFVVKEDGNNQNKNEGKENLDKRDKREKRKENIKKIDDKNKKYYVPQQEYIRILKKCESLKEQNGRYIKDNDEEIDLEYIPYLLLRSMREARYFEKDLGHFGIAFKNYCHFTSPIRRYSDLFVHRMISKFLDDPKYFEKENNYYEKYMLAKQYSAHISDTERKSKEMEREYDEIKKAEYIQSFEGSILKGRISGIMDFGYFVDLSHDIEGLVRSKDKVKFGQTIYVKVIKVDEESGLIDLIRVEKEDNGI